MVTVALNEFVIWRTFTRRCIVNKFLMWTISLIPSGRPYISSRRELSFSRGTKRNYSKPLSAFCEHYRYVYVIPKLTLLFHTLQFLHQGQSLFHRDIRWPNVLWRADDPSLWFLIDLEHATRRNNVAAHHLHPDTHCPKVFVDSHGGEVDVWGVGLLIKESRSFGFSVSAELLGLAKWMQNAEPTSQDALAAIMKYKNG
jgi:hypothetical protein